MVPIGSFFMSSYRGMKVQQSAWSPWQLMLISGALQVKSMLFLHILVWQAPTPLAPEQSI